MFKDEGGLAKGEFYRVFYFCLHSPMDGLSLPAVEFCA
jgi:hypothetical protein